MHNQGYLRVEENRRPPFELQAKRNATVQLWTLNQELQPITHMAHAINILTTVTSGDIALSVKIPSKVAVHFITCSQTDSRTLKEMKSIIFDSRRSLQPNAIRKKPQPSIRSVNGGPDQSFCVLNSFNRMVEYSAQSTFHQGRLPHFVALNSQQL